MFGRNGAVAAVNRGKRPKMKFAGESLNGAGLLRYFENSGLSPIVATIVAIVVLLGRKARKAGAGHGFVSIFFHIQPCFRAKSQTVWIFGRNCNWHFWLVPKLTADFKFAHFFRLTVAMPFGALKRKCPGLPR